jgi:hypothetical protein
MAVIATIHEAEVVLRARLAAMPIADLALLVKVASEAINDIAACREIAEIVEHTYDSLNEWGERVLYTDPVGGHDTLCVVSEVAMCWYENVPKG